MKKVILVVLASLFAISTIQPAQSEVTQTIAIIDSAVDSSKIKNVIYEACFTQENTCPNKTNTQEGYGSASVSSWTLTLDHGNQVSQAAVIANPNVKIVFIRIGDETSTGGHLYGTSRQKAMDWIVLNQSRFGIQAVSVSQSLGLQTPSTCLTYAGYKEFRVSTQMLFEKNIPVFAATGNNSSLDKIGFPACIDNVIAVGATRLSGTAFASYSNIGKGINGTGINAVARGDATLLVYGKTGLTTVTGTSIATPIAASFTVANIGDKSFNQLISTLPNKVGYPQFGN